MSEPVTDAVAAGSPGTRPPAVLLVTTAVLALAAGYAVDLLYRWLIASLWVDVPSALGSGPVLWAYLLTLPVVAGVVVALLRRRAEAHGPLDGFSFAPVPAATWPFLLGAILVTLAGGLVLGPEAALITTGSFVGTLVATRAAAGGERLPAVGAVAALLALVVQPMISGSGRVHIGYDFSATDLPAVVLAALAAAAVGAAVRLLALRLVVLRGGDRPVPAQLAAAGLGVGALAVGYVLVTGRPVVLVMTSGEGDLMQLLQLPGAGLLAATVAVKALAYAMSLAGGFRGGPFFPVFFIGTGVGALVALATGAAVAPAATAGLIAGTTNLARARWPLTLAIGAGLGFLLGGPALVPAALLGAAVGRVVPKPAATSGHGG